MLRRFKKSVLKKKLSILPSQKQSIRFLAAREKFNDDVKTISAKLAEAKKANAKVGVLELLEQLEKEHPAISKEAFACMAALISDEKRRKSHLSAVINAIKKASKVLSKDVNEVECSIYECNWCAMNNAAEYSDDYNVFAVDCNVVKLATCLLCGKKNYLSGSGGRA